ncbi:MAG TPA: tRNA lysidine(34) synthetase TilS [Hyphomicrobiaceae bacterium]|nr:tRNA lysidine(34) synthetase TilS [Hyphomicrobiaceae bacterium]
MTSPPPIEPEALAQLFGRLPAGHRVALAVSGGGDSTALMVLFAEWLSARALSPAEVLVLTVDHGLRLNSGAEAQWVARLATTLGYRHAILPWLGPKPVTGIQAAARAARYGLLAQAMHAAGRDHLLTAHTADDQAETLLMRLARGSGLDGLAAMAPLTPLEVPLAGGATVVLARPLLGVTKARLEAALVRRGIGWLDDSSNTAARFERSRLRAAAETLAALGLSADKLGLSARRLQRARAALEAAVAAFCSAEAGHYRVDALGYIAIDRAAWRRLPDDLALRVLVKAIAAAGGTPSPVPLAKLERLGEVLAGSRRSGSWTLARTAIKLGPERIIFEREPGRAPGPELILGAGQRALWDGRFWVAVGAKLDRPLAVRALGECGLSQLNKDASLPAAVSRQIMRGLPGFWQETALLAVPSVRFPSEAVVRRYGLSAVFAPMAPPDLERLA